MQKAEVRSCIVSRNVASNWRESSFELVMGKSHAACFGVMLPIELRLDRAQRVLRMIEEDAPLLAARVAPLSRERQQSTKSYAQELAALARAEIKKLMDEKDRADAVELMAPASD
jgi:hypothetical protein